MLLNDDAPCYKNQLRLILLGINTSKISLASLILIFFLSYELIRQCDVEQFYFNKKQETIKRKTNKSLRNNK